MVGRPLGECHLFIHIRIYIYMYIYIYTDKCVCVCINICGTSTVYSIKTYDSGVMLN